MGVEIGGTKIQAVLGDAGGQVHQRWRGAVDRERGAEGIRRQLQTAMDQLIGEEPAAAIGVGFGGPVDWRSGRIARSHQIGGWEGFELGEWMQRVTGSPAFVDNDANVAALGEAAAGSGRGFDPLFYVTLGSGVGGGLVVGGRIYHGASPGEAEFGHMRLDRSGTTVEQRCSGWAVDARIRAMAASSAGGGLSKLIGARPGGEARHLAAALAGGEAWAGQVMDELAENLAFGLSHVAHLLHPQAIVLGGGLALVGEPLRQAVAARLPKYVMEAFAPGPAVLLAGLGEDPVPVGALILAGYAAGS